MNHDLDEVKFTWEIINKNMKASSKWYTLRWNKRNQRLIGIEIHFRITNLFTEGNLKSLFFQYIFHFGSHVSLHNLSLAKGRISG